MTSPSTLTPTTHQISGYLVHARRSVEILGRPDWRHELLLGGMLVVDSGQLLGYCEGHISARHEVLVVLVVLLNDVRFRPQEWCSLGGLLGDALPSRWRVLDNRRLASFGMHGADRAR